MTAKSFPNLHIFYIHYSLTHARIKTQAQCGADNSSLLAPPLPGYFPPPWSLASSAGAKKSSHCRRLHVLRPGAKPGLLTEASGVGSNNVKSWTPALCQQLLQSRIYLVTTRVNNATGLSHTRAGDIQIWSTGRVFRQASGG